MEETKKQSYYIDDDGKTTYTDVHSADWEKRKGILNARIKEAQPEILDPLFYESSYINNDGRRIGAPIDSITWKKRKSDLLYRLENDDTESLSRDLEMLDDMVQQEKHISTSYLNEQNHRIHSEIDSIAWKTRKNFLIEKIQAKPLEDTLSETKRLDDMIQQENAAFDQEKLDEMLAQEKEYDEAQNQNVSTIMRCPNCGHELTIGDDFCTNCGTSITGNVASTGTNQPKRSMALPIILISAIVLIAIIVGVIVMAHSAGENSRKILSSEEQSISRSIANNSAIVPSVAGQTLSQAVSTLKNDGFTHLSTQEEYNTDQSSGNVIKTNPAANSRVNKDMTITIYVSKGTQMITVPDVTGQSEANAKAKLTNLGFKVTTTTQSSNDVASGTVLSMSPAAGASQAKGSTIALTISSGATLVTIPNWSTSMTATNLQSQLQALGVQVNMV
ncbi:MAG: PASTA domain-containing protein, partial [Streptococcaceae bacterium]|nr:PASTA domain-containing protein [Streptococcaceae bacterium]